MKEALKMKSSPIPIALGGCFDPLATFVNGIEVDFNVFAKTGFSPRKRSEEIASLMLSLAESKDIIDKQLMRIDIQVLLALSDDVLLLNTSNGHYVSPTKETGLFNELCNEIIITNQFL